jgi:hypothetical protein
VYLDQGGVLLTDQPNIASINSEHPTIPSSTRGIDFMQAAACIAKHGLVLATEVVKVKRKELSAGYCEVKRKLLRGGNRNAAGSLQLSYPRTDFGR